VTAAAFVLPLPGSRRLASPARSIPGGICFSPSYGSSAGPICSATILHPSAPPRAYTAV
jgi:hypothetical protein